LGGGRKDQDCSEDAHRENRRRREQRQPAPAWEEPDSRSHGRQARVGCRKWEWCLLRLGAGVNLPGLDELGRRQAW
jgi:hypothetical protein